MLKNKTRLTRHGSTLAFAALLTAASLAALSHLESGEERGHHAQVAISDLQGDLNRLQSLPFQVTPGPTGPGGRTDDQLDVFDRKIELQLERLTELGVSRARLAPILGAYHRNIAALHRLAETAAGHREFDEAATKVIGREAGAAEAASTEVARRLTGERARAHEREGSARLVSTIGSTAVMFLLLLAFSLFFHRAARARAQAVAARAEAEQANRAKSEFLSRMSHELRTPLNSVIGFGQLLATDELTDRQRSNVDHIARAGAHLLDLVNEVLDISRIESGELRLSLEPVPVGAIVDDAMILIGPLASARRITIDTTGARDRSIAAQADVQRLKQVLLNLLSNAIKYNHDGGRVEVSVRYTSDDRVEIDVRDDGPGIRPEQIDMLFSPFERLDAHSSAVEGTGLGLALSRGFVEAMAGHLDVTSTPGAGSTFTVSLAGAEPVVAVLARIEAVEHDGAHTVVCIEDNPSNIALIEQIFALRPHVRLVTAIQGALGLDLVREHRPALVLLDLHLPDFPGEEVLARMQADPSLRDIPVVVVSADASPGRLERILENGAHSSMSKPIDVAALLRLVDAALLEPMAA